MLLVISWSVNICMHVCRIMVVVVLLLVPYRVITSTVLFWYCLSLAGHVSPKSVSDQVKLIMAVRWLSVLLLLAVISSTAAAPWELGDTFATTNGRLNVIDSRTLVCWFFLAFN